MMVRGPIVMDAKPTLRKRLPFAIALCAGVVGAVIGWRLVSADVARWTGNGFTTGPEMQFVVFMAVLCAVVAFVASNRLLNGPKLRHDEWTVLLRASAAAQRSYRDGGAVRLAVLQDALARWGYDLRFELYSDAGRRAAPATAELIGPRYEVRERRIRYGRLRFWMTLAEGDAPSWGSVEVDDVARGTYGELAHYLIFELGRAIPGVEFKRSFSSLSPEAATTLAPQLPDRPHYLPRSPRLRG